MITNAQKINYKYLSLCPPDCVAAEATALFTYAHADRLFCQGGVMHMLRTVHNKTHDIEALVRACSAWEGVKTHRYAVLKDVGNGILLDRPLPFKLHQSYRPLPCFIPALQEIWSDPAKNSAVMTVMTSTPRSASHYRGEAVMRLSSQPYPTFFCLIRSFHSDMSQKERKLSQLSQHF